MDLRRSSRVASARLMVKETTRRAATDNSLELTPHQPAKRVRELRRGIDVRTVPFVVAASSPEPAVGLSERQAKALGPCPPPDIWHLTYKALHGPAAPGSFDDEDEEQTYEEFEEMGRRRPNALGTGRFKVTKSRRTIGVIALGKAGDDNSWMVGRARKLVTLIHAYTGLPAELLSNTRLELQHPKGPDGYAIIDEERGLSFPLACHRSEEHDDPLVDVFSVFDVLVEYVQGHHYSVVALLGSSCAEDDGQGGFVGPLLGRACGNRVAAVSCCDPAQDIVELYGTSLHELFHTMGMDHTVEWQCLMNSQATEEGWLFLSPHNLRKLKLAVCGTDENPFFVQSHYERLLQVWSEVFEADSDGPNSQAGKLKMWMERKVDAMSKAASTC